MMLRRRGFHFSMPLDQEVLRVQQFAKHLTDISPKVLTAVGIQAVSWVVRDFRTKSDRQSAAGVQWRTIGIPACVKRVAGRPLWKKQQAQLLELREQQEPLVEALRMMLPPGPTKDANRRSIAQKFKETKEGKALAKIRKKRAAIRDKRKKEILKEHQGHRIGVDTGRLVNSLVYGVQELSNISAPKMRAGAKPPDRAFFDMNGFSIRVGSRMDYAEEFDRLRPIFSPNFIDPTRRQLMDKLIEKTIELEFNRKFGGPFGG